MLDGPPLRCPPRALPYSTLPVGISSARHGAQCDLPIYRTQLDNEVLWCFGVKSGWAVNCTTAVNLGVNS
jgi:hypothetical protein